MTLRAGAAQRDISPRGPVALYGYPHVTRLSTGIHDPLLASALMLDRAGTRVVMVSLDLLLLSGLPAFGIAAAKTASHWLVTGVPLLLAAGPVAIMLRMPEGAIPTLLLGLLLGSMLLSLFGTMGASIVLGARRGGVLLPLLVLPLVTPVLIFGVAASALTTQLLRSMLYGTKPLDLAAFAGAAMMLVAVAMLACLIPAWRASRIDPMAALRHE